MIGIAYHSPSLVSLMIDREKFTVVMVPSAFDASTQAELDALFSKKRTTKSVLFVDKVETLSKVASRFPDASARIILFDVVDNLESVTDVLLDVNKSNASRLVAIKPDALNPVLQRIRVTSLSDHRKDYEGKKAHALDRDGDLVSILRGASDLLQKSAAKFMLGQATFPTVKRSGRQDQPRVLQIRQYFESSAGDSLTQAYMDVALYGTDPKIAALFSSADLEDSKLLLSIIPPEPDMDFGGNEVPDKLRLARE